MAYVGSPETLNALTRRGKVLVLALFLHGSIALGQETEGMVRLSDEFPPEDRAIHPPQREGALYFGKGSSDISPEAQQVLYSRAKQLIGDRRRQIVLTAYLEGEGIDSLEIAAANMRLKMVSFVLQKFGVFARQISSSVVYENNSTSPCATETCRVSYRRVELRVKTPPGKSTGRR
jgi:outer membrane protein OmpA-like peptidoglycan-associated protein